MLASTRLNLDEVSLNLRQAGDGVAVLLLHGFPDSGRLFRHITPQLTANGYRVLAPDLRGYGATDAPVEQAAYRLSRSAHDMLNLLDVLGLERVHLVGHDWGAVLGWYLAGHHPTRFFSFTALSVGHPKAYFRSGLGQLLRAWYILIFLTPGLGEWLVRWRRFALLRSIAPASELERWIADLSRPRRTRAALSWYRANVFKFEDVPPCQLPTLGVWSTGDVALGAAQMQLSERYVTGPFRMQVLPGAGHHFPCEVPDELARLLVEHFESTGAKTGSR